MQLAYDRGRWRITYLTLPYVEMFSAPHVELPPAGLPAAGRVFVERYVGFLEYYSQLPPGSKSILNTIATNQDPLTLSGVQPTGAHLQSLSLSYGRDRSGTVVVSCSITLNGSAASFAVLMHHTSAGWRAETFLGSTTGSGSGSGSNPA